MTGRNRRAQHVTSAKDSKVPAKTSAGTKSGKDLRRQAEKILRKNKAIQPETLEAMSLEEIRKAIHELQVHQIELEMQNEELQRTQAELDLARARYFDLYDLAPVGYCTLSDKGLIKEANLTAASLLGVARSELVKKPMSRFIVKEDLDGYYLLIHQLVDSTIAPQRGGTPHLEVSPEPHLTELRMKKPDGTVFWVSLKVTAVHGDHTNLEFRLVLSDISEHKRAEAQQIDLETQTRQIEKAESLQRMAGAIAHLFNNQLSVILGNLEMTLYDSQSDALPHQYLVNAMRAVRRSSEVSSLLLTYLGQITSKPEPLDLSVFCRDNLPVIQAELPVNIALETDFLSPGPIVQANANQIQQILTNLITNGWEAIGDTTGRISVATKTIPTTDIPRLHIAPTDWQTSAETFACLEVTDSGCGMTEQEMDRIFDPFFSTKFTGRGLGLAVVSGLAKAWDGMIAVASAVGRGSTLQVFLPLVTGTIPTRQAEATTEPCELATGWTVLLVDDDATIRDTEVSLLKHLGLNVLAAASGEEAVTVLKKNPDRIDCLLTDLFMPGMDGWETLAAVRKIRPDLPAILSSGYGEAQAMSGDYGEQPQAFLHKPFSRPILRAVICRVMSGVIPIAV